MYRPGLRCAGVADGGGGGGGLGRNVYNNTFPGTVPAALSALTNLIELCAAPRALARFAPARARGGCARQPVRAVCGGGGSARGEADALAATMECRVPLVLFMNVI